MPRSFSQNNTNENIGSRLHSLMSRLFPICRSITGDGVRKTLDIFEEFIPVSRYEIDSGTEVFDWTVPDEWNIKDAYIMDASGKKIVDFQDSNLHVMGYSEPVNQTMSLEELKPHLYFLEQQPDAIPYVTSYYKKRWGFCLTYSQYAELAPGKYTVRIDSEFSKGSMTYADLVIPGKNKKEILISSYICHPSMANNELSGPVLSVLLAEKLLQQENHYTYRFAFVPETIGAIAYIHENLDHLKERVFGGYVLTCIGDGGQFSYLESRSGRRFIDRLTKRKLSEKGLDYRVHSYLKRGSDERQYCSPGVDLPIGSFMRTRYLDYPEYHTSHDNLDFVSAENLAESFDLICSLIEEIEQSRLYKSTVMCEPHLSKYDLYNSVNFKDSGFDPMQLLNVIGYSDGDHSITDISELIGFRKERVEAVVSSLEKCGILEEI